MKILHGLKTVRMLTAIFALIICPSFVDTGYADGLIIIHNPHHIIPGHFTFAPLEVTYHRVNVDIKDQVAVTSVDQEFFNPNNSNLEGTYIFPLPAGAHIDKFSMDINGKMMDAELLPAEKARSLYEDIVRKMKDPALLEYAGRDAFKVRIFPIEPHSRKQIKIKYTQILKSDSDIVEYIYPLNTEKFSSAPIRDVSVKITLDGKAPLKSIYCPSHSAEIKRDGEYRALVGFEAKDVRPDSDFKIIFSRKGTRLGIDMLCNARKGEEGYFMLLASPGMVEQKSSIQPKDICFVMDTSGSMAGSKLEQAKKALLFCIANLNDSDRFEIIRFSTEAESYFNELAPAGKSNIEKAEGFINGLKPIGGTAIGEALKKALSLRAPADRDDARPYIVIFLTDGLPTIGETGEDSLVSQVKKDNGGNSRIFSFGIGTDVNTHLLDRISEETRAASQYVLPKEDLEVKLSIFYSKIKEPVFCNIKVSFSNPDIKVSQLYPNALPDLFNGDMLMLFGKYSGKGKSAVKLEGTFNGKKQEFRSDVVFAESETGNEFIPQLWAARRVGWLLDEIRMHGESSELKDEVSRLAREFGIVTPYTAYLIIEDEKKRDVPAVLRNFQELERDRNVLPQAEAKMKSLRTEAASEVARSGGMAVGNARSLREMKDSPSSAPILYEDLDKAPLPAKAIAGYRGSKKQNYAQQSRVLNGRAFYQNGNVWTDSTAQSQRNIRQQKIVFNSDEYFTLQKKHPDAVPWFSLSSNIDIVLGDTVYQIREE
ncbi:MAG: VIT domain-containing protein [Victivallales bacterium]